MNRKLKWLTLWIVTLALTLAFVRASGAVCATDGNSAVERPLQSLDGGTVKVSDYQGKVVVMSFWATWCQRCGEQLKYLQELSAGLSDDVVVLAINQDSDAIQPEKVEEIRAQVRDAGLSVPVLVDADLELWGDYCLSALPTNVILDRDGRVAFAEPNFYWASKEHITQALDDLGGIAR